MFVSDAENKFTYRLQLEYYIDDCSDSEVDKMDEGFLMADVFNFKLTDGQTLMSIFRIKNFDSCQKYYEVHRARWTAASHDMIDLAKAFPMFIFHLIRIGARFDHIWQSHYWRNFSYDAYLDEFDLALLH
ncbi:MAG: hypothetical protein LBP59_10945 [Planctomycetaceae bacterium]|jgi:hypothetical protein|nr:hypothetical protein [Planctomycetaceae bacterium]